MAELILTRVTGPGFDVAKNDPDSRELIGVGTVNQASLDDLGPSGYIAWAEMTDGHLSNYLGRYDTLREALEDLLWFHDPGGTIVSVTFR